MQSVPINYTRDHDKLDKLMISMTFTGLDFVYTLKQESSGFADELGMKYKKNQEAQNTP